MRAGRDLTDSRLREILREFRHAMSRLGALNEQLLTGPALVARQLTL